MTELRHTEFGARGEAIACDALLSKGYSILERNYRWKHLEIDIIALKCEELVFVEVKTRGTAFFGEPYNAVTRTKQKQLIKAANAYIHDKNLDYCSRFDVFSIILNQHERKIEHIEYAFTPG